MEIEEEFDFPLPGEYDEISEFESKYADEFDLLNEMEENEDEINFKKPSPRIASRARKRLPQDGSIPKSKKKLNDEFLRTVDCVSPDLKRQRIEPEQIEPDDDFEIEDDVEEEIGREASFSIIEKVIEKPIKRDKKYVYTRPPYGTDSITTTDTEGRRVFLKMMKESDENGDSGNLKVKKLGLLAVPFSEIKQAVDDKRHKAIMKKADIMNDLLKELNDDTEDFIEQQPSTNEPEEALWVEKYTPKRFTELLSDDGINRVLLKWIKLWDNFVFGKTKTKVKKMNKSNQVVHEQNKFGKRKFTRDYEDELDSDVSERPTYKIALLAGNPGLGKTTLAHVVAKHAGYNPVEMNASDDRSAELFKNKLETATQMKACIGNENRPNCLIIDEIDGAPLQAINILLQAAKETEDSTKKKKNKGHLTLTRPVICICNDQYVPALRQLRQVALTLTVPQISPGRLAQRLLEISRKEQLKADMACLLALCDKSENDIRSCVNTLQFISKKHGVLKAHHLQDVSIGQKDFQKGLSFVWKSIFQLPKPNRRSLAFLQHANKGGLAACNLALSHLQSEIGSKTSQSSNSVRFHNILHLASSNSEYEKMIQGIFDNYLHVKSKDPHLDSVVKCSSWLQFADLVDTRIRSRQTFTLMKFFPFLPVAFHMSLAAPTAPKITFNNSMIEFNSKQSRSMQLIEGITHEVRPHVRRIINNTSTMSDLLPFLYEVIHPSLRPVNVQLYSQSEKQQLLDLISIMISYNLTYHQERSMDGQFTYVLHPNIEELIAFPGLRQHKRLNYAAKQLIQREIDLEKMRKVEQSIQINNPEKKNEKEVRVVKALKPVKVKDTKAKPVLDFFGRVIQPREKTAEEKRRKSSIVNTSIWYKFNEGYTNAVRRSVKVIDFL